LHLIPATWKGIAGAERAKNIETRPPGVVPVIEIVVDDGVAADGQRKEGEGS
jgi:hypothetical protein